VIFTENCQLEITQEIYSENNQEYYPFHLSTISGYVYILYSSSPHERELWIQNIESNKVFSMLTRLDEFELRTSQGYDHLVSIEQDLFKTIQAKEVIHRELNLSQQENLSLRNRIQTLENTLKHMTSKYEESEKERVLFLNSNGIIPKSLPKWMVSNASTPSTMRIWVGTWNLGASDPVFRTSQSSLPLEPFVIPGYDLYCLGVQECVSESFFHEMDSFLAPTGVRRLRLVNPLSPGEYSQPQYFSLSYWRTFSS
jgi:hypothetical protein